MDRLVACIAIVGVVVVARTAYRLNLNFFTFVTALAVATFGAMCVTGTLP